jgi:YYY domain-containing protein
MYVLGTIHLLPFTQWSLFLLVTTLLIINSIIFRKRLLLLEKTERKRLARIFFFEELLFLGIYLLWIYIRSFAPDIHGLEKYMDFGFINSLLRSSYFPPKDMWFTPLYINYYYFGHLVTAVLTKLTGIPSAITFNCMLATITAFCFTGAFSLASTLLSKLSFKSWLPFAAGAILTASMLTFGGNLHTIYAFFTPYNTEKPVPFWDLSFSFFNPCYKSHAANCLATNTQQFLFPNSYWYPNATRFIYHTIHEFPIYSWVVSDLHGHVLDIPFVLLFLAFFLETFFHYIPSNLAKQKSYQFFFVHIPTDFWRWGIWGVLLATMYMTNAWDGIIYLLLTFFFLLSIYVLNQKKKILTTLKTEFWEIGNFVAIRLGIIFITFLFFALPFSLFLKPPVSGIGILCAPKMITDIGKIGPFLFEANHCQRSAWWQLLTLYGAFLFFGVSFFFFLRKQKKIPPVDQFVACVFLFSTLLIIIPEFIYLKDIYPDHYRANTMFKLVFQAFMLLSLCSGYVITRFLTLRPVLFLSKVKKAFFTLSTVMILCLCFLYPYFAVFSFYGDVTNPKLQKKSLDGTQYLSQLYPDDYKGVVYLDHLKGQPVILEAQGDSYTDFGRVSTNTGLPTVLGWTVHEWLWRGTYDVPAPRIEEVKALYESTDIAVIKTLLTKYHIDYVFVGDLEHQKYTALNEATFQTLGKLVFSSGNTHIYQIK